MPNARNDMGLCRVEVDRLDPVRASKELSLKGGRGRQEKHCQRSGNDDERRRGRALVRRGDETLERRGRVGTNVDVEKHRLRRWTARRLACRSRARTMGMGEMGGPS